MAKTQLLYLPRFDVLEGDAQVVECRPEGDSMCVILAQTVFYPGGGGQPADAGELLFADIALPLQELWMDDDARVIHRVASSPVSAKRLRPGSVVHMKVDVDTRIRHNRLHSAGHIIDIAVSRLGYDWTPTKGAHFPHMAFVEYTTQNALAADAKIQLQAQCDQLIAAGSTNTIKFMDDTGVVLAPASLGHLETERVVEYDGFAIACGGTHVSDIAQVGRMLVKKVKKKKGVVKVSYTLESL